MFMIHSSKSICNEHVDSSLDISNKRSRVFSSVGKTRGQRVRVIVVVVNFEYFLPFDDTKW